jgi:hypothetical protein
MARDEDFRGALVELFRSQDPAGLIRILETPDNEYEPEVDVVITWTSPASAEQVKHLFVEMLDADWGSLSDDAAERLAEGIRGLQREHGVVT